MLIAGDEYEYGFGYAKAPASDIEGWDFMEDILKNNPSWYNIGGDGTSSWVDIIDQYGEFIPYDLGLHTQWMVMTFLYLTGTSDSAFFSRIILKELSLVMSMVQSQAITTADGTSLM